MTQPSAPAPAPALKNGAVLDASVLFQEPIRTLLLWIAGSGAYTPLWSERIIEEVRRNLFKKGASDAERWEHLVEKLRGGFADAWIDQVAIDALEPEMPNDEKDRHVLAVAVVADAPLVVTNNLKHFRQRDLASVGRRSLNADDFLCDLLERAPISVEEALRQQAALMKRPRQWKVEELLGRIAGLGKGDPLAPKFAARAAERFGITLTTPPARPTARTSGSAGA